MSANTSKDGSKIASNGISTLSAPRASQSLKKARSQLQEALYATRQNYCKKLVAVHIQLALEHLAEYEQALSVNE